MRICILAPEFLPVWGGVGSYIVGLTKHLPKSVEIHVVTPARDRLGSSDVSISKSELQAGLPCNVHVHTISKASDTFVYNAFFQYACLKFVPAFVKDNHIDLIHSHTAQMPDLLLEFRKLKVPTITTVHTTIFGQRHGTRQSGSSFRDLEFSEKATLLGYPFLRLAEKVYFSFKHSYLTPSNWMKDELVRRNPALASSKVWVVPNSVDTTHFHPSTNGQDDGPVLFTGRLVASKGLRFLIDAIPAILTEYPDTRFVFVGPGNYRPYDEKLRRLGVPPENYEFKGYLKGESALVECYQSCSVFVAPTLYENMPIRILEAMACGKPVASTNVCAIPEVINSGSNGILFPPQDSAALSSAICELLGDTAQRRKLGENARRTVEEQFNWAINSQRILSIYEELLSMT